MATMSRTERPRKDRWNSFTVPWKAKLSVAGMRRSRTALFTRSAAWPSEKPGAKLNEIVTAGSCPKWFTDNGPTVRATFATVSSGTSGPCEERTYSFDNASGERWYSGAISVITAYWLAGVKMVETWRVP